MGQDEGWGGSEMKNVGGALRCGGCGASDVDHVGYAALRFIVAWVDHS